jgi:hypothetical protein
MPVFRIDLADAGSPDRLVMEILKAESDLPIPVPVEQLAVQLGITEIKDMDSDGFIGGLITNATKSTGVILVNEGLRKERGRFYIVASGRCNHAGVGNWQGLTSGNTNFIGIEAENTGYVSGPKADPWPAVQIDVYRRGVATILKKIRADPIMCCGHKEYALPPGRKDDPTFDMSDFRSHVSMVKAGIAPSPSVIPAVD